MNPAQVGVVLVHLGTPEAPTAAAVRRYLADFLSDRRVVDRPRWWWLPLLYGVILPLRARRSAAAYRRIWWKEGSPLMAIAGRQAAALQQRLGDAFRVALAMRYGAPTVAGAVDALWREGCRSMVVLPAYPQYSATTTASVHDAWAAALAARRDIPAYRFVRDYHDHPQYIAALAGSVRRHWRRHGRGERLLFSFHGIPERYADAGDPYPEECRRTARLLAAALELAEDEWLLTFQSRFGREPWIGPYTDETLRRLGGEGCGTVDVICPGFAADCLETLDEIACENAARFAGAGGGALRYIPALNDDPEQIELWADLVTGGEGLPSRE
ncbi:MAG: ferrochelatase [Zetaproteobacteria bacterium]|nr:MAG: ferrochelatase [Zetaproteobacteria bacterium]